MPRGYPTPAPLYFPDVEVPVRTTRSRTRAQTKLGVDLPVYTGISPPAQTVQEPVIQSKKTKDETGTKVIFGDETQTGANIPLPEQTTTTRTTDGTLIVSQSGLDTQITNQPQVQMTFYDVRYRQAVNQWKLWVFSVTCVAAVVIPAIMFLVFFSTEHALLRKEWEDKDVWYSNCCHHAGNTPAQTTLCNSELAFLRTPIWGTAFINVWVRFGLHVKATVYEIAFWMTATLITLIIMTKILSGSFEKLAEVWSHWSISKSIIKASTPVKSS